MKRTAFKFWTVIIFVCIVGFMLAKMDSSRNWDDTGITVGLVLISSFLSAVIMPRFAWLWAIIIGGFIWAFNVVQSSNYGSFAALIFAFMGAYSAVLFKKLISNSTLK